MKRKPTDRRALICQAIAIIAEEREVVHTSYKETDGVVREPDARAELRKYDRWLKKAKATVA